MNSDSGKSPAYPWARVSVYGAACGISTLAAAFHAAYLGLSYADIFRGVPLSFLTRIATSPLIVAISGVVITLAPLPFARKPSVMTAGLIALLGFNACIAYQQIVPLTQATPHLARP